MQTVSITQTKKAVRATKLAEQLELFKSKPDEAGVSIPVACAITDRSRASINRDIKAGRLESVKINGSRRLRVGSLRKMLAGGQ
jgi:hypothetical protein